MSSPALPRPADYYCRMYSSGKLKDSDSQSTCTKKGRWAGACAVPWLSGQAAVRSLNRSINGCAAHGCCGLRMLGSHAFTPYHLYCSLQQLLPAAGIRQLQADRSGLPASGGRRRL